MITKKLVRNILETLAGYYSKEVIVKILTKLLAPAVLRPLIDSILDWLEEQTDRTETTFDDQLITALRQALDLSLSDDPTAHTQPEALDPYTD